MRIAMRGIALATLLLATAACADLFGKGAVDDDDFDIDLEYFGTTPVAEIRSAVEAAAARLERIVTADVEQRYVGETNPFDVHECYSDWKAGVMTFDQVIVDDVVMVIRVDSLDGRNSILASAGPCLVRDGGDGPTIMGLVTIDSADATSMITSGRLTEVLTHELLHALGIGSVWEGRGMLLGKGTSTPRVTGSAALAECRGVLAGSAVCDSAVPAEDCENLPTGLGCGSYTLESHWKESTFEDELMTGYVESGGSASKLSRLTIAALQDLGYTVDLTQADTYTVPSGTIAFRAKAMRGDASLQTGQLIPIDKVWRPRFILNRQKVLIPLGQ